MPKVTEGMSEVICCSRSEKVDICQCHSVAIGENSNILLSSWHKHAHHSMQMKGHMYTR